MGYVYEDQVRQDILRMIPEDGRVIGSIGCGRAATEATLVAQGREVHGVDVSSEAVEAASARLTSARVVRPDERELFATDSLDGLILADVIEHIPAAWQALADFARFVRPGGWVVISVPNMRNLWEMRQYVWRGDWPEDETGIFDRTHVQFMTHRRLERWTRSAGLTVDQWFARPDPRHPRATPLLLAANRLLFGALSHVLDYQIQVRCRKPAPPRGGTP